MECREITTARGEGWWGYHAYHVALVTVTRTYTSSDGSTTKTLVSYGLRFRPDAESKWEERVFASMGAREGFLEQSFSSAPFLKCGTQRNGAGAGERLAGAPTPRASHAG